MQARSVCLAALAALASASVGCSEADTSGVDAPQGAPPYTLGAAEQVAATTSSPWSIALDDGNVFWSGDDGVYAVSKAPGSASRALVTNLDMRGAQIAVDGNAVFYANRDTDLESVPKAGGAPRVLATNSNTNSGNVAAFGGQVYWTNFGDSEVGETLYVTDEGTGATSTFEQLNELSFGLGASASTVWSGIIWVDVATRSATQVTLEIDGMPADVDGITVTSDAVYVTSGYWDVDVTGDDGAVTRVPLDGSPRTTLVSGLSAPSPPHVDDQNMFSFDSQRDELFYVPIAGGPKTVVTHVSGVRSIAVDDSGLYWSTPTGIFRAPKSS